MKQNASHPTPTGRRIAGRAQRDPQRDPYHPRKKLKEPTACERCGAVFHNGRWQWGPKPADAEEMLCPACRRIKDGCPAGIVLIGDRIVRQHKDDVIALARKEEAAEMAEHPLNRLAGIEQTEAGLVINTTDIHLPI